MPSVKVKALSSFDHGGDRKKNSEFLVSDQTAKQLAQVGLVRILGPQEPEAGGAKSSASPAAPASKRQTAKKSKPGAQQGSAEAS